MRSACSQLGSRMRRCALRARGIPSRGALMARGQGYVSHRRRGDSVLLLSPQLRLLLLPSISVGYAQATGQGSQRKRLGAAHVRWLPQDTHFKTHISRHTFQDTDFKTHISRHTYGSCLYGIKCVMLLCLRTRCICSPLAAKRGQARPMHMFL